jgi:hypothetical protein
MGKGNILRFYAVHPNKTTEWVKSGQLIGLLFEGVVLA